MVAVIRGVVTARVELVTIEKIVGIDEEAGGSTNEIGEAKMVMVEMQVV